MKSVPGVLDEDPEVGLEWLRKSAAQATRWASGTSGQVEKWLREHPNFNVKTDRLHTPKVRVNGRAPPRRARIPSPRHELPRRNTWKRLAKHRHKTPCVSVAPDSPQPAERMSLPPSTAKPGIIELVDAKARSSSSSASSDQARKGGSLETAARRAQLSIVPRRAGCSSIVFTILRNRASAASARSACRVVRPRSHRAAVPPMPIRQAAQGYRQASRAARISGSRQRRHRHGATAPAKGSPPPARSMEGVVGLDRPRGTGCRDFTAGIQICTLRRHDPEHALGFARVSSPRQRHEQLRLADARENRARTMSVTIKRRTPRQRAVHRRDSICAVGSASRIGACVREGGRHRGRQDRRTTRHDAAYRRQGVSA